MEAAERDHARKNGPSPASEPVIEVRGLTKVFRDFFLRPRVTAVEGLDMEVRAREVFGLLGPNGSGKSTTIKIMLGLLHPTRGEVRVFGRKPTDVEVKHRIGYLPEETNLYPFLSAREILDYYGRLFRLDASVRKERIDALLEMLGLEGAQDRLVGEFSRGMQRRVGLAQALINDPDLLVLDEPTTGLDPIGTRQIKDLIVELNRAGKTVLLSSHQLADVEAVCDRVAILYGGKKRVEGSCGDLLTVGDCTVIETGSLRPETVRKVKDVIAKEEGKEVTKVEAPRQRLETLFLDAVRDAESEGVMTSGVRSGGGIARFLAAGVLGSEENAAAAADRPGAPEGDARPAERDDPAVEPGTQRGGGEPPASPAPE